MVENPRTGEQVTFVSETDDLLVMDVVWPRPGLRALEHIHPYMEERWHVLDGRAAFRIDGIEVEASPGSVVVAPPGRRHLGWNAGDGPVHLRIEMRPSLRWRVFVERFFAGDDPLELLETFSDEIVLPEG